MRYHGDGCLEEAEYCYREALAAEHHNGEALHGLGLLEWQTGRLDDAHILLKKACDDAPGVWRYRRTLGKFFTTVKLHREALEAFEHAKELAPASAESWFDYANALHTAGRHKESIPAYRRAIALDQANVEARNNLGAALDAMGDHAGAVQILQEGLAQNPAFLPLHNNLGNALLGQGLIDEAIAAFQNGLCLDADSADIWFNLGNAYAAREPGSAASDAYQRALALAPGHPKALVNLGNVLRLRGELSAALAHYRRAMQAQPGGPDAYNNAGITLHLMGNLHEAGELLQQAIALAPNLSQAHSHLGNVFKDSGRLDEALACYRRAMALAPHSAQAHGNLLYAMQYHQGSSARDILEEAQRFGALHGLAQHGPVLDALPGTIPPLPQVTTEPGRRIRIGYVSPDFRQHCQSLFTLPLLSNHDAGRFEIYCYAHLARPDDLSRRVAAHADVWRPIYGKSDAQVADMIAADGIDILVDLTMHMANGRPLLFARKPAPIQLAWLAYPGTTGLPQIDYRLTDPWLDPVQDGNGPYTEQSVRLPDTFWCYDPLIDAIDAANTVAPGALPAQEAGRVTFGCLNNFCKVSDDTLNLWGQVLSRLPASRLLLLAPAGQHRERVAAVLARHGIDAARIEFALPRPRLEYLQLYHRIDLCLDTVPYNGHTTNLDAFWMGVPVVTLVGDTVAGRAGWSQLNNLGLPELAAFDAAAFVDIACGLAADLPRLADLRQGLRARMAASPLMDGQRFARAMETIYEQLLQGATRQATGTRQ